MTDALMDRIKAHRSAPDVYDPPTFDQMADRVEQTEAKLAKAVEALREIKSITVHSGGDLNHVKASAWRDAFEQAHCEACAVLAELEGKE